jgi:hypothetical protein
MFFDDPVEAFTNVGRALRPDARLVLLVWQAREHNAWAAAFDHARTGGGSAPDPAGDHKGAFSLGDPATTAGILTASGFTDVQFTDVAEPVYYGPDATAAYDNALELFEGTSLAAEQRERLRAIIAAHEGDDGVHFDSRAWIVTARRGGSR